MLRFAQHDNRGVSTCHAERSKAESKHLSAPMPNDHWITVVYLAVWVIIAAFPSDATGDRWPVLLPNRLPASGRRSARATNERMYSLGSAPCAENLPDESSRFASSAGCCNTRGAHA